MEGVWTGLGQNARANCVMEVKMQMLPCFANGRGFWAMGCFRAQRVVFMVQGDVRKMFQKLAPVGFSWCSSSCVLDKFLGYEAKGGKWQRAGLYRLAIIMHTFFELGPKFVDLVCCNRLGAMLKRNKFAKVMLYENGSATFMPKMELFIVPSFVDQNKTNVQCICIKFLSVNWFRDL